MADRTYRWTRAWVISGGRGEFEEGSGVTIERSDGTVQTALVTAVADYTTRSGEPRQYGHVWVTDDGEV